MFWDKTKRMKLKGLELQIIEIQGQKREMEIELKNQKLDLSNSKREQEAKLEEERQKHRLVLEDREAKFKRQESEWLADRERLQIHFDEDKARAMEEMTRRAEVEQVELKAMMKLESEQKIAKALLEAEKKVIAKDAEISDLKKKHAEEMATQKSELTKEHYDNLKENLEKFHSEGNTTTKFMQEMSLAMLEKRPPKDMTVGVDVSTLQLERSDDGK